METRRKKQGKLKIECNTMYNILNMYIYILVIVFIV